jgi:ribosomal protein S12 methylthiotransferase accessory factor
MRGREVYVPQELVALDASWPQPKGHGLFLSSSKGLACGNTRDEAILHALCELIERDAYSLWRQKPRNLRAATAVDPHTTDDAAVAELMERYDRAGMIVRCWDITSDLDVPCFVCIIDDQKGRPPFLGRFVGLGCHPAVGIALSRALTEAAQTRLAFIVGTREDMLPEHYAGVGWHRNFASLVASAADAAVPRPLRATSFDTSSIAQDIEAVMGRLSKAHVETIVAVDLTSPELQIPCIRLVSPDLEGSHQQPGYRRGPRVQRLAASWN